MCFGGKSKSTPAPAPAPVVQNPDQNVYQGSADRKPMPTVPEIGGLPQTDAGTSFGASLGGS